MRDKTNAAEYSKKWRKENAEHKKQKDAEYYQLNKKK